MTVSSSLSKSPGCRPKWTNNAEILRSYLAQNNISCRLLPLIITAYLIFVPPARADAPPIALDDYWQKVDQTQALVALMEDPSDEAHQIQLTTLADEWENITQVTLPSGTIVPVNHSYLVSQLRASPPDLARLKGQLTALLAAHNAWPAAQHTLSDLQLLDEILARPEFQWTPEQPSLLSLLLQRLLEFFWEIISPLLPEEAVITLDVAWFRYLLTGLATLLLILVLAFMLRGLLADLVTEAEINVDPETGKEILTANLAIKRAQGLSDAGDYRTAIRYLYLSSLLLLDERGLLRYNRSQTNREYLRSVAHLPHLAAILREVIDVFDRVWYGYQAVDKATYIQYAARVEKLRQQK